MHIDKILRPDSKHRICLGSLAKGISGYKVTVDQNSKSIILTPYTEIPLKEKWLFDNTKALESVRRGLQNSASGRIVKRSSFANYITKKH